MSQKKKYLRAYLENSVGTELKKIKKIKFYNKNTKKKLFFSLFFI